MYKFFLNVCYFLLNLSIQDLIVCIGSHILDKLWKNLFLVGINIVMTIIKQNIYKSESYMIPSDVRSANSQINNKATTQVSDGSLYLGFETTFTGHKGCHPFSEFPF